MRLLVHSARQVVQVCVEGQRVLRGADMDRPVIVTADPDCHGLAVAVDRSVSPPRPPVMYRVNTVGRQQVGNSGRRQVDNVGRDCRRSIHQRKDNVPYQYPCFVSALNYNKVDAE